MPTNKITLRSTEEFMSDYVPTYQPLYPLFFNGKAQQYTEETGELTFRRVEAFGDIRARRVTPKDTDIKQISVREGRKTFNKYFFANQYIMSMLQNRQGVEEVTAQVLDEHHLQADELLLTGDGTNTGDILNNGLFYSNDPNYAQQSPTQIASANRLYDFHAKVMSTASDADQVAGRKVVIFYGDNVIPLYNSLYDTAAKSWRMALEEALGSNYSTLRLPKAATPSGVNGWIIANMDQTKLHFTTFPKLLSQGVNEENMYVWGNFLVGSMMLDVLAEGGIIHQPATLE